MVDKVDGKKGKISKVDTTQGSEKIEKAKSIQEIERTKKTQGVGKVSGVGAAGNLNTSGRITAERRDEIFKMIEEEADKLFGANKTERREVIEKAVKMAIDAAMSDESKS